MFAIGHFALGYLAGKGTGKLCKTKIIMPLILLAAIIPDTDLVLNYIFPSIFVHRGFIHSIAAAIVIMIPFFVIYKKQALPYFAALLSHSLIGDFFSGGAEIFWPLSHEFYGFTAIEGTELVHF